MKFRRLAASLLCFTLVYSTCAGSISVNAAELGVEQSETSAELESMEQSETGTEAESMEISVDEETSEDIVLSVPETEETEKSADVEISDDAADEEAANADDDKALNETEVEADENVELESGSEEASDISSSPTYAPITAFIITGGVLTGIDTSRYYTNYQIPYDVTAIAPGVFENVTMLEAISFKKYDTAGYKDTNKTIQLTTIGKNAFKNCTSLEKFDSSNVQSIENNAFEGCTKLNTFMAPKLETIGDEAFKNCKVMKAFNNQDRTVTEVGKGAFQNCEGMTSMAFLNSELEVIPERAFYNTGLNNIGFSNFTKLTEIGASAFQSCKNAGKISGECTITIPSTCKTVGASAFEDCIYVTSVKITEMNGKDEDEITIGENAFKGCERIVSAEFKAAVPQAEEDEAKLILGKGAFDGCKAMTIVTSNVHDLTVGENAFSNCKVLKTVALTGRDLTTDLENKVTIEDSAFSASVALATVSITAFQVDIKPNGFRDCGNTAGTASVSIKADVVDIAKDGFKQAIGVKSLKIEPRKYKLVDEDTGNILNTVKIGKDAFNAAEKLAEVNINAINVMIIDEDDEDVYNNDKYNVNGSSAFLGCENLSKVNIDAKVSNYCGTITLGDKAFHGCTALNNPIFSAKNVIIGEEAFEGCNKLVTFTVKADDTTLIGRKAFYQVKSLKYFNAIEYLNETGLTIMVGGSAFEDCSSLTKIDFKHTSDQNEFETNAFKNCIAMTNASLPGRFLSIGTSVFEGCIKLATVVLPLSISEVNTGYDNEDQVIPEKMFYGCTALKTVTFETKETLGKSTINTIGRNAFSDCANLTTIEFPKSVKKVYEDAFSGCGKLATVIFNFGEENKFSGDANAMEINQFAFPRKDNKLTIKGYDGYVKLYAEAIGFKFVPLTPAKSVTLGSSLSKYYSMTVSPEKPTYGDVVYITLNHKTSVEVITTEDGETQTVYRENSQYLYELSAPTGINEVPQFVSSSKGSPTFSFIMKDTNVVINGTTLDKKDLLSGYPYSISASTPDGAVSVNNGLLQLDEAGDKVDFTISGTYVIPKWLWTYETSNKDAIQVTQTGYFITRQKTAATTITATSVMAPNDAKAKVSFKVEVGNPSTIFTIGFPDVEDDGILSKSIIDAGAVVAGVYEYKQSEFIDKLNPDKDLRDKNPDVKYPVITFRKNSFSNRSETFVLNIDVHDQDDTARYAEATWTTSDSTIAKVEKSTTFDNQNRITIPKNANGEAAITVKVKNLNVVENVKGTYAENKIIIRVVDTTPRIVNSTLTINSESSVGCAFEVLSSYEDTIDTTLDLHLVKRVSGGKDEEIEVEHIPFNIDFKGYDSEGKYLYNININGVKAQTVKNAAGMYLKGRFNEHDIGGSVASDMFYIPVSSIIIKKVAPKPSFKKSGYINTFFNGDSYEDYIEYYYDPETKEGYFADLEADKKIASAEKYYTSQFYNYTAGQVKYVQNNADIISNIQLVTVQYDDTATVENDLLKKYYTILETDEKGDYDLGKGDGRSFTIRLAGGDEKSETTKNIINPETGKNAVSGYLRIEYVGFENKPIWIKVTIPTKNVPLKYTLTPSSTSLYQMGVGKTFELQLIDKFKNPVRILDDDDLLNKDKNEKPIYLMDKTVGTFDGENTVLDPGEHGKIKLTVSDDLAYRAATTKAVMGVTQPTWSSWVPYTFTLKTLTKAATPKFKTKSIVYNKNAGLDVSTLITFNQQGFEFVDADLVNLNSTAKWLDGEDIIFSMDIESVDDGSGTTQKLTVGDLSEIPNGTYKFKFIPHLKYGDNPAVDGASVTFSVTVKNLKPTVKLKSATFSLNSRYVGDEKASTNLTISGLPKDAKITGFDEGDEEPVMTSKNSTLYGSDGEFTDGRFLTVKFDVDNSDEENPKLYAEATMLSSSTPAGTYAYTVKNLCVSADGANEAICLKDFKLTIKCIGKPASIKWTQKGTLNPIVRSAGITLTGKPVNLAAGTCILTEEGAIKVLEVNQKESERFEIVPAEYEKDDDKTPIKNNKFILKIKDDYLFKDEDFKGSKKYKVWIACKTDANPNATEGAMLKTMLTITVKQTFPKITGKFITNTYIDDKPFTFTPEDDIYWKSVVASYCKYNTAASASIVAGASEKNRTLRIYIGNTKQATDCEIKRLKLAETDKTAELRKAFTIGDVHKVEIQDDKNLELKYYEYYVDIVCKNPALLPLNKSVPLVFETVWYDQVEKTVGPRFTLNLTVKK